MNDKDVMQQRARRLSPQTLVAVRAVAQVGRVVEADEPLGAAGAGQGGEEAGGLALVALALVVGQQLKHLLL